MNKNCMNCSKILLIEELFYPNRKFCNRDCYTSFIRKKFRSTTKVISEPIKIEKINFFKKLMNKIKVLQQRINLIVFFIIAFCTFNEAEVFYPNIIYKPFYIFKIDENDECCGDVFYIPTDIELDLII